MVVVVMMMMEITIHFKWWDTASNSSFFFVSKEDGNISNANDQSKNKKLKIVVHFNKSWSRYLIRAAGAGPTAA